MLALVGLEKFYLSTVLTFKLPLLKDAHGMNCSLIANTDYTVLLSANWFVSIAIEHKIKPGSRVLEFVSPESQGCVLAERFPCTMGSAAVGIWLILNAWLFSLLLPCNFLLNVYESLFCDSDRLLLEFSCFFSCSEVLSLKISINLFTEEINPILVEMSFW